MGFVAWELEEGGRGGVPIFVIPTEHKISCLKYIPFSIRGAKLDYSVLFYNYCIFVIVLDVYFLFTVTFSLAFTIYHIRHYEFAKVWIIG